MSAHVRKISRAISATIGLLLASAAHAQGPVSTAFTYQGQLSQLGNAATGTYDLKFRLFDNGFGGNQVGPTLCSDNVPIVNGAVTALLNFGSVFNGQRRFLEIQVRADTGLGCGDDTGFETLTFRQELTAAPYASYALNAAIAQNAFALSGQPASFYRNAANLTGTLPLAALPTSVARLDTNQSFTGVMNFTNPGSFFAGTASNASNASALNSQPASFYLNAANLTGALSDARLSSNIARLNANQTFTGAVTLSNAANNITGVFSGNGAGLTSLNGASIAPGTLIRSALSPDLQAGLLTLTGDWAVAPYRTGSATVLADSSFAIDAAGGRLYVLVSGQSRQLQAWGLSNPAAPNLLGSAPTGDASVSFAIGGSYAYVGCITTSRLKVFNISSPGAPVLVGDVPTGQNPRLVSVAGGFAYVINYDTGMLQIFDLATPETPVLRGSTFIGLLATRPAVTGSTLCLTNANDNTLRVLNVANPDSPVQVGIVHSGVGAADVAVAGQYAYVGLASQPSIRVYNISNPQAPALVRTVSTVANTSTLFVSGGYLYVVTYNPKNLQVFDLSVPDAPTAVGSVALGADDSYPTAATVVGSNAYVLTFSSPSSQNTLQVVSSGGRVSFGGPLATSALAGADGSGLTNVNASSLATGTLSNARTTGTAQNTASALVVRDASGNFSAGTITANLNGNALTATSANSAATAAVAADAQLLNGQPGSFYTNASNITSGTLSNAQTTGADAATPSTLVLRDASGNFSANVITATTFVGTLAGNAATATSATSATSAASATNATQLNGQPAAFYTSASNIAAGTLADARLSGNVPRLNASNSFSGSQQTFAGNVLVGGVDNVAFGLDAQSAPRLGVIKKSGFLPMIASAANQPIIFAQSDQAGVLTNIAGATLTERLRIASNGNIQIPGGVITTGPSAVPTTDLGLYSQTATNWMRFVTNNGAFQWFSDAGAGTTPRMTLSPTGNLSVTGTLSKGGGSFKIDHPLDPENKYLYHSFVESPDMMNVYNGNVTTDAQGRATITLPDYFEALNRDFRYQLTVIDEDSFALVRVSRKIAGNTFEIASSEPGVEVSWQVTGIRKDAWANKNRIPNAVDKSPAERGRYLHPEAFGKPSSQSVMSVPAIEGGAR